MVTARSEKGKVIIKKKKLENVAMSKVAGGDGRTSRGTAWSSRQQFRAVAAVHGIIHCVTRCLC